MSRALQDKTIALAVGGGIAAYRACELARLLMKRGARVRVVMTTGATKFVSPLTFQALTGHPVLTDLFDPEQDASFGHLALARAAQLFVVAPATADVIGRMRAGLANDAVTSALIAARCPVLLAPAMNTAMWEHPRVQENLAALLAEKDRYASVGPASGVLADGDVGQGRLAEPPDIADAAEGLLSPKDLAGKRVVLTAGPTREHLDPVRFISNPSTGRMGYALARAAALRGADVTLVSGPVSLPVPPGVRAIAVTSAEEMARATFSAASRADVFIATAAVADQRPRVRAKQKVKKPAGDEAVVLVRTPDILAEVSRRTLKGKRPVLVGFAAETEKHLENGREKLERKQLDLLAVNDVGGPGGAFGNAENRLTVLDREGGVEELPQLAKEELAHLLLDRVQTLLARPPARRRPARRGGRK